METLLRGVHMGGTGSMPVPPIFYATSSFMQLFQANHFFDNLAEKFFPVFAEIKPTRSGELRAGLTPEPESQIE